MRCLGEFNDVMCQVCVSSLEKVETNEERRKWMNNEEEKRNSPENIFFWTGIESYLWMNEYFIHFHLTGVREDLLESLGFGNVTDTIMEKLV